MQTSRHGASQPSDIAAPGMTSAAAGASSRDKATPPVDAWAALVAAAMAPDDFIVIERDGELFIEPVASLDERESGRQRT